MEVLSLMVAGVYFTATLGYACLEAYCAHLYLSNQQPCPVIQAILAILAAFISYVSAYYVGKEMHQRLADFGGKRDRTDLPDDSEAGRMPGVTSLSPGSMARSMWTNYRSRNKRQLSKDSWESVNSKLKDLAI